MEPIRQHPDGSGNRSQVQYHCYERHGTPATDRGRYRKKRTKVVLG
ncbi:hypothetical protein [Paenibacillus polymyxa]|nr:hypothetical protein [Paenibacillus polymyxa]UZP76323.2 hypothetical protein MF626_004805 [Paenibacillus polymyxa]